MRIIKFQEFFKLDMRIFLILSLIPLLFIVPTTVFAQNGDSYSDIGNQLKSISEHYMGVSDLGNTAVVINTNLGKMVIEFFPAESPNHVENFISLSESGFYDGTVFHRIIPGFMIQGGDPNSKNDNRDIWGMGGPETNVDAEFNTIKHNRGIVSMARAQDPNSAGSQFFIVHKNSNFLDGQYTVFGRLITEESYETLDKIANVNTDTNDRPINSENVEILKVDVIELSSVENRLDLYPPERIGQESLSSDSKYGTAVSPNSESQENKVYTYSEIYAIADDMRFDCEVNYGPPFGSTNQQFSYNNCMNRANTWELDQLDRTDYYGEPKSSSSQGGGCLIATATFDSELAPQVQKLREIRDSKLLQTESGSQFMESFNQFYYSFSPIIADYERENPVFKEIVKVGITPMISTLSLMDYADTESEVLGIGISLIILNAMMYVGLPVFGMIVAKKRF